MKEKVAEIALMARAMDINNMMIGMDRNRVPIVKDKEPGRNDKCPCGSGAKYKNCCMKRK